jgi:capsid protein
MGWAVYNDRRVADPPADWRNVKVFPPRMPNVDPGRNMQALCQAIQGGITDYAPVHGALGEDWKDSFDRLQEQQAYAESIGLKLTFSNQSQQPQVEDDSKKPVKKKQSVPA